MSYIEIDPEWIEAIHKAIDKWNSICMCGVMLVEPDCALCDMFGYQPPGCRLCPLFRGTRKYCTTGNSIYDKWSKKVRTCSEDYDCDYCDDRYGGCPDILTPAPTEAWNMLEALVNLLPESERERYE